MSSSECPVPPRHLAVVMDGNQRWARARGLPGPEGHRVGAKAVKTLVKSSVKVGIEYLTLFAFSSENWRRPAYEVELLMQLFYASIDEQLDELDENAVKLLFIGDLSAFSEVLQAKMASAVARTKNNTGMQLSIAVNYGGQWDIWQAACQFAQKEIAERVAEGQSQVAVSDIPALLAQTQDSDLTPHVCLGDAPPVDLFIRTSGERRISNFLLWQLAYAELYFTDTYWPDFDEESLRIALEDFAQRQRRFGCSSEELLKGN